MEAKRVGELAVGDALCSEPPALGHCRVDLVVERSSGGSPRLGEHVQRLLQCFGHTQGARVPCVAAKLADGQRLGGCRVHLRGRCLVQRLDSQLCSLILCVGLEAVLAAKYAEGRADIQLKRRAAKAAKLLVLGAAGRANPFARTREVGVVVVHDERSKVRQLRHQVVQRVLRQLLRAARRHGWLLLMMNEGSLVLCVFRRVCWRVFVKVLVCDVDLCRSFGVRWCFAVAHGVKLAWRQVFFFFYLDTTDTRKEKPGHRCIP